jgi:hypothetical protein
LKNWERNSLKKNPSLDLNSTLDPTLPWPWYPDLISPRQVKTFNTYPHYTFLIRNDLVQRYFNDYYEMDGCSAPMTFFEWVLEPQRTHELYAYDCRS